MWKWMRENSSEWALWLCAVSSMPTRYFWDAHSDLDQPHALCKQQFVGQFGFSARANKSVFFGAV